MQLFGRSLAVWAALGSTVIVAVGCGSKDGANTTAASQAADNSASGAAAGAVGGALSGSGANGSLAFLEPAAPRSSLASVSRFLDLMPAAQAEALCPTFRASSGNGCQASGGTMWLTYNGCTFAGIATWTGVQSLSMSAGTAACGSFPNPGANGTLYRQFVQAAGSSTPGHVSLSAGGLAGTVDDAAANLNNFDGDSVATISNGGYGEAVAFGGTGARSAVTVGHNIYVTGVFNHSVTGAVSIAETPGATSRTISGSVQVYHNLLRVIGTSVFNNVVHQDGCCLPVSGSITTTFSAGNNVSPTLAGAKYVGASETLTFGGTCGQATYTGVDGSRTGVSLSRCF